MESHFSTVVIAVSLDKNTLEQIKRLRDSPFIKYAKKIIFMHVFNDESSHFLPYIPDKERNFKLIQNAINDKLDHVIDDVVDDESKNKCEKRCFFDDDAKLMAVEFLKEAKADLVIAACRSPHFFTSSFSWYLVEHAPCDIHIIHPCPTEKK